VASKAKNRADILSSEDIAELLDELEGRMDRCKVMFEQYFLGIQKTGPMQLQIELERRIRKLTQTHISNTGLRFRFTTLSQKFASYNTYWKRTMRQIENGSYIRDIAKLGRDAIRDGKDIPDELLAKMPKRMRERIQRDRDMVKSRESREQVHEENLRASGKVRDVKRGNVHQLDAGDLLEDLDMDSLFAGMTSESTPAPEAPSGGRRSGRRAAEPDTDVDQLFSQVKPAGMPGAETSEMPRMPAAAAPARATPRPPPARTPPPQRTPAPQPTPPPQAKPPPGMSVAESQALYSRYKKARELVGENTSNLSYNRLMSSLNKQAPKILKDHQASGVSFDVVVKGDRVVLKAKPKK
jgi:hypothetical protein